MRNQITMSWGSDRTGDVWGRTWQSARKHAIREAKLTLRYQGRETEIVEVNGGCKVAFVYFFDGTRKINVIDY